MKICNMKINKTKQNNEMITRQGSECKRFLAEWRTTHSKKGIQVLGKPNFVRWKV